MLKSFIKADTEIIENKHSGNYISNLILMLIKLQEC